MQVLRLAQDDVRIVPDLYVLALGQAVELPAAPNEATQGVAKALATDVGLDGVPVQHDDTLRPPRTVVSYPNGYNGGTAADGFGGEFQSGSDFASLLVWGHCVPGDVPKLGTPMNPRPTDPP